MSSKMSKLVEKKSGKIEPNNFKIIPNLFSQHQRQCSFFFIRISKFPIYF